jgi:adenylylsulfate kinase
MLIVMAGLPGTGKSTIARALASRLGGTALDKDVIRAALFTPADIEYSTAQDDFVMGVVMRVAQYLLKRDSGRQILIDGRPFSRCYQLEEILDLAEQARASWRVLECVCSEETARRRLALDTEAGNHPAANRRFEMYLKTKAAAEPITFPKIVLDTDQPLDVCVALALAAIQK